MYYDRRIPAEFLDLLQPGAALGWVVPWLSTDAASSAGAHVQTRRDRHGRKHGSIQIYLGRTSPLEVRGRSRGRLRLHADRFYQAMTPHLFARDVEPAALAALAPDLIAHVERAAEQTHRSFLDGEAVVHAGLMRHYGPLARGEAPWLALDSEARVGFASRADQVAFEAALSRAVGLPTTESMPRKLDLVATDQQARLLLVEVKADATGLARAAWQGAVHVARFRSLLAEHPAWFSEVLGDLARDKAGVGLLGRSRLPGFNGAPTPTPVIAAPDERADWHSAWRREIAPVMEASRGHLGGLRLWRLNADGQVLEEVTA